jgi:hypothetical protein
MLISKLVFAAALLSAAAFISPDGITWRDVDVCVGMRWFWLSVAIQVSGV